MTAPLDVPRGRAREAPPSRPRSRSHRTTARPTGSSGGDPGRGLRPLVLLVLIGFFLFMGAFRRSPRRAGATSPSPGSTPSGHHPIYGVLAPLIGTLEVGRHGHLVGTPVAIAVALFLSEYAPPSEPPLRSSPSSTWPRPSRASSSGSGRSSCSQPNVAGFSAWLSRHASFIPFFKATSPPLQRLDLHRRAGGGDHDRAHRGLDQPGGVLAWPRRGSGRRHWPSGPPGGR